MKTISIEYCSCRGIGWAERADDRADDDHSVT